MEEEIYWQGLLGALDESSKPGTSTLTYDSTAVKNIIENVSISSPAPNSPNRNLTTKSIETVSAFVDVDLEDEQQYYFKYYKEYFESSYGSATADEKDEPTLSTVDVWCEGSKVSTSYNFVILNEDEGESEGSAALPKEDSNTNDMVNISCSKFTAEGVLAACESRINRNNEKTTNPSSTSASPVSILNNYIPRFIGMDRGFKNIFFSFSSSDRPSENSLDGRSKPRSLVSLAVDTVVFAKDKVVDQVSNYFRTNFYISSFVGCVSESAIFLVDRVQTTSYRYVNQLTADDPEQMHLERVKNSLKWNHIFLRYSMASLSWKERQLIEETQNEGMMEGLWQTLPKDKGFRKLLDDTNSGRDLHESLQAEVANGGDEATQYALEKFFSAPPFEEKSSCAACCKPFNLALFRHHCRNCGRSFCDEHSKSRRCIFRFGLVEAVRVCAVCCTSLDEVHRRDGLIWKECRVNAYLTDRLIPYFNPVIDRGIDKALRVADYSIIVAKNTLTLNYPTKIVLETVDILKRYGLAGFAGLLLRKDFMDSVETLKRISGMDTMFSPSIHELTACIYYKLAIERGIRGCNVHKEFDDHGRMGMQVPVDSDRSERRADESLLGDHRCEEVSNEDLNEVIRLAPLALKIAYERSSVDCQRLARLLGWETLFSNADESLSLQVEQPCYALLATSHQVLENPPKGRPVRKEAVLTIRGTQTMQDVVTDIRAIPEEFSPSQSALRAALKGLARPSRKAADNDNEEQEDDDVEENSDEDTSEPGSECEVMQQWEWLRGSSLTPVDESGVPIELKKYACGGMSRAAMNLLREVGPSLVKLHLAGYSIKVVGHSLGGAVAAMLTYLLISVQKWSRPLDVRCITYGCPSCVDASIADLLAEKGVVISAVLHDDVISRITPQSIRLMMRELMYFRQQVFHHIKQDWSDVLSRSMSLWSPRTRDGRQLPSQGSYSGKTDLSSLPASTAETSPEISSDGEGLLVQDITLLDLWIPGKIIHIYSHNGQYRACMVPRSFPDIRKIILQCNMFEDHRSKNILDALLSVKAVREADRTNGLGGPRLVPYDASNTCQCCNHSFTWHSTFRGQAQEYRERYNCKYCGGLVCGPCSTNKRAMPAFGFIFPRRICDACLYKGEYGNVYTV